MSDCLLVDISSDSKYEAAAGFSGVGDSKLELCDCPNCGGKMFPGWVVNTKNNLVQKYVDWPLNEIWALFCPRCAFYMEDYWIFFEESGDVIEIFGGERDGGIVLQDIDFPYQSRALNIVENNDFEFFHRPRHQIGGVPFKDVDYRIMCPKCKSPMSFLGVLDYDDKNVPLYENGGHPVALIIGDYDCLNIYSCSPCRALGFHWAQSNDG